MARQGLLVVTLACMVIATTAFNPVSLFRNQDNKSQDNIQDKGKQDNLGNQDNFSKANQDIVHHLRNGHTQGTTNGGNYANQNNYNNGNQYERYHPTNIGRQDDEGRDNTPINTYDQRGRETNRDGFQNDSRSTQKNTGRPDEQNNQNQMVDINTQDSRQRNPTNQDNLNVNQDSNEATTKAQDPEVASRNIFKKIGKGIEKEIKDIKQPVLAGVVSVASSQCDNLKKIAGVAYEQLDDEAEPDVSQLTLRFISGSYNITYNITTAARDIPAARNHDPSQRLYIFLHGFTDDPTKTSYSTIRTALYNEGKSNVLGLDASSLIHWLYLRSTTYVQFIGEKLGEVLAALVNGGVDRSNIHIIGHSLGAHIAGFTGKQFQRLTGARVGRISGLDPAGPCFAHVNDSQRLNATDAEFVDVIHTDSGVYGIKEPVGQVDYYPNEGKSQPGCFFETCSHSRAVQLFADSIQHQDSFPAVRCQSWERFEKGQCERETSYMGLSSRPGTVGQYYLQTGSEAPFGRGPGGAKYKDHKGVVKTITHLLG